MSSQTTRSQGDNTKRSLVKQNDSSHDRGKNSTKVSESAGTGSEKHGGFAGEDYDADFKIKCEDRHRGDRQKPSRNKRYESNAKYKDEFNRNDWYTRNDCYKTDLDDDCDADDECDECCICPRCCDDDKATENPKSALYRGRQDA